MHLDRRACNSPHTHTHADTHAHTPPPQHAHACHSPELETPGDGHFARDLWIDLEGLHKANPLAVQVHPDGTSVLSSSADKQIVLTSIPDDPDDAAAAVTAAEVIHTATGPVLCLAVNPVFPDLVLAGDMAGGTVVFSIAEKKVVFVPVKHSKYVVRVAWSACGKYFATASYDSEAQIYTAVDSDGADATAAPYKLVKTLRCKGQVWPHTHTHKRTDTHTHDRAHHVALVLAHPYPLAWLALLLTSVSPFTVAKCSRPSSHVRR